MIPRKRTPLSAMQRVEVWHRWKGGESLHAIGRALGKDHVVVHLLLKRHGGIAPTPENEAYSGLVSLVSVLVRNWTQTAEIGEAVEKGEVIEGANIHAVFMHVAESVVG